MAKTRGVAMDESICERLASLTKGESDLCANLANTASLIYTETDELNWAGFYIMRDSELVLGPFMGKPACVRIKMGRGVCGTAAASGRICRVDDVHCFEGHIACDPDSRSELVIPIRHGGKIVGVLDLDSAKPARFTSEDEKIFTEVVRVVETFAWGN